MHNFKRQRSHSAESVSSSTSAKRSGSSPAAVHQLGAMDLNDNTSATSGSEHAATKHNGHQAGSTASSSSSTEPLVSDDGLTTTTPATTAFGSGATGGQAVAPRMPPPSDGTVQLESVLPLAKKGLKAGEPWFIVDRRWYRKWQAACGDAQGAGKEKDFEDISIAELGPIDNSALLEPGTSKLLKTVTEGQDAMFLPGEAWDLLVSWYGSTGAPLQREVIATNDGPKLDLHPPTFSLSRVVPTNSPVPPSQPVTLAASSGWTIAHLKTKAAEALLERPTQTSRLWHLTSSHDSASITVEKLKDASVDTTEDDQIIRNSTFTDGEYIAIEEANDDGSWLVDTASPSAADTFAQATTTTTQAQPRPLFGGPSFLDEKESSLKRRIPLTNIPPATTDNNNAAVTNPNLISVPPASTAMRQTRSQTGTTAARKGLVGLTNLGNTCFMNSALQCLSNTPSLQHYFQSGFYTEELNPDNPLGMNGEVAKAFGQLIRRLWSGDQPTVTPRDFKQTLSKFAPAFSGWQQHDSQELIAFLLDGLHEDLNRIKKKPYDEIPDWNGGGDKEEMELANVSWELYKRRNDSVIVDLFQGQYRSRLVCPECNKVAIKFDPFMYLSLAIPQNKKWQGSVYLVPADPAKMHVKATVELPANATFKRLKQSVGELTGYDPKRLFLAEEWAHKFYKVWSDTDIVGELSKDDIIVMHELPYEINQPRYRSPREKTLEQEGKFMVSVVSFRSTASSTNTFARDKGFGEPFILALTAEEACDARVIERKICERLASWKGVGEKIWANATPPKGRGPSKTTSNRPVIPDDEDELEEPGIKDVSMQADGVDSLADPYSSTARLPNYKVARFLVSPDPTINSAFCDGGFAERVTLQERAQRVHDPSSQTIDFVPAGPPRIPGAFGNDDNIDLYGDDEPAGTNTDSATEQGNAAVATEPSAPIVSTKPILRTGETVLIEWNTRFATEAFGTDAEKKRTEAPERFSTQERITEPALIHRQRGGGGRREKKGLSVEELLDEFVKEEKLSEDNTWYCPACKKHQEAQKKFDLWKMPDVLVIHLKRFSNERAFRDKIDDLIEFPIEGLDLSDRVEGKKVAKRLVQAGADPALTEASGGDESLIYDLFAVDNHFGGLGGGHYTAFAKNINDGRWYNFDDSRVSPVANPQDVRTSAAYLLFYCRRTDKPIGGKTHEILASQTASPAGSIYEGQLGGGGGGMVDGEVEGVAKGGSSVNPTITTSPYFSKHPQVDRFRQIHGLHSNSGSNLSQPSDSEVDLMDGDEANDNFSTAASPSTSDDINDGSPVPRLDLFDDDDSRNSSTSQFSFGGGGVGHLGSSSSMGWNFAPTTVVPSSVYDEQDDSIMAEDGSEFISSHSPSHHLLNSPARSSPASSTHSPAIEIKIDPSEMARVAEGVDLDAGTVMDELE